MTNPQTPATIADRLLRLAALDQALDRLLRRPRAAQVGALALCAALIALSVTARPAGEPRDATSAEAQPQAAAASQALPSAQAEMGAEQQAIRTVEAYNQASVDAAREGRVDPLLPHLDPDGSALAAARAEYERRVAHQETRDATLARWRVLRAEVDGARATVETQELWDDVTWSGGALVSSRRGVLTQNVYELRLADRWLIVDVKTTVLMR